jgi:hypothetical protein
LSNHLIVLLLQLHYLHYLDLLNIVSARLSIDKANNKKSYTQQGEKDRALSKLNWANTFLNYVEDMSKLGDMNFDTVTFQRTDLATTYIFKNISSVFSMDNNTNSRNVF